MSSPASLWNRSFALALVANFIAFFVTTTFALYPLWILDHGGSERDVGLLMGMFSVVAVVLRPIAGQLADRTSYRRSALWGFAALAAVVPMFALVEAPGPAVALLRALMGAAWSLTVSPLMALATMHAPAERTAEALGTYGISGLVANAVAPLVGEELVHRLGFGALFGLDGALLVLAVGLIALTREIAHPAAAPGAAVDAGPGAGPLAIGVLVGLVVVHGAVRGSTLHFVAPFAREVGVERVSGFFVAFTATALLTRIKLSSLPDRLGPHRVAIPAALLLAATSLVLSQLRPGGWLLVAGALGGLGQGLIFPALSTLWLRLLGAQRRAFALAIYATVFDLGFGLGLPTFGLAVEGLGYRWSFAVAAAALALSATLFGLLSPAPRPDAAGRLASGATPWEAP